MKNRSLLVHMGTVEVNLVNRFFSDPTPDNWRGARIVRITDSNGNNPTKIWSMAFKLQPTLRVWEVPNEKTLSTLKELIYGTI